MALVKRKARKRIRASKAAEYFSITTETFIKRCRSGLYPIQLMQDTDKPVSTTPYMCYQVQVEAVAERFGIL